MTNVNAIIELNELFLLGKIEKNEFDKKAKKIENFQYFNNLPDFRKYELEYLNSVRADAKAKADAIKTKENQEKNERLAKEKAEKAIEAENKRLANIAHKQEIEAQKANELAQKEKEILESKEFLIETSNLLAQNLLVSPENFEKFKRYCELYGNSAIDKKAFYGTINGIRTKVQYKAHGIEYTSITRTAEPVVKYFTEFQILKNGGIAKFLANSKEFPFIETQIDKTDREIFSKALSILTEKRINELENNEIKINEISAQISFDSRELAINKKVVKHYKNSQYRSIEKNEIEVSEKLEQKAA